MNASISGGRKTAVVEAQNTGTDWVQIGGDPGTWCALPYSISAGSSSAVQLQRRTIGGSAIDVLSTTDGAGTSAVATLPLTDDYAATAGNEYRLWVATGDYGNAVTLGIGA